MGHQFQSRVLLQRAHQLYSTARISAPKKNGPFQLAIFSDRTRLPNLTELLLSLPRQSHEIALIFRDYDMTPRDREYLGRELRQICRHQRVLFFVAGDLALAKRLRAEGVHLPEWQVERGKQIPSPFLTTAACHNQKNLKAAEKLGVDAAFISPVFSTASHPQAPTLGTIKLAQLVSSTNLPIYGLGGITVTSSRHLTGTHIAGFGAIDGLLSPPPAQGHDD